MANSIQLRPSYWASVSGGKDSLFMLKLILEHPEQFPLDGVVHFELEIDFPFIHQVVDYMQKECEARGIRFVRIKPRKSWIEIYNEVPERKNGNERYKGMPNLFPTRTKRWCNSDYKLDANRQLKAFLKSQGAYLVSYIGYCFDETKRYEKRKDDGREIYPLVEYGINENTILEWARHQPIFNNFYKTNRRCGCMYCPLASRIAMAYTLKYYPEHYDFMMQKAKETEAIMTKRLGKKFCVFHSKYDAEYFDNIVRTKWIRKLNEMESIEQLTIFDVEEWQ